MVFLILITITVGYFFYTQRPTEDVVVIKKERVEEVQKERNLVALGDSITNAAVMSSEKQGDNREYSFSTGTSIDSLYKKLLTNGENIVAHNLAVSGSKSEDVLNIQVPQASSYNPKYITIIVGGNDLLGGIGVNKFKENLSLIASQIKAGDTKVLIASNPNVSAIRNMEYPACQKRVTNALVEAQVQALIDKYNKAIEEVAIEYSFILVDLHSILDSGDVSAHDCIHLNESGQKKMAQAFYNALVTSKP